MNIFRLAFELFALYLLYKLIFDLIIPMIRTTQQVKKQFGDMSARMQEKINEQQRQTQTSPLNTNGKDAAPQGTKNEDYIEFEDVK
ncbi:MAG: hypothetical protein WKI04_16620 [Ferruginibacter sp.]